MKDYIEISVEVKGRTLVKAITWDFDSWCLDGFYSVLGTGLKEKEIFDFIHGNMDNLQDWEENVHPFPNEFARECTDEEIETYLQSE